MMNGYIRGTDGEFCKYTCKKDSMDAAVKKLRETNAKTVAVFRSNLKDVWFTVTTHKPTAINQIQVKLNDDGTYKMRSNAMYEKNGKHKRCYVPKTAEPLVSVVNAEDVIKSQGEAFAEQFEELAEKYKQLSNKLESETSHPSYYGGADNPYELMKVFFGWGIGVDFCKACIIKYLIRAGLKCEPGDVNQKYAELRDVKKALTYAQFLYDYLESEAKD